MIRARRPAAGFTLIEAIMVIVITGILAGIVAVFITNPVQGYVDAVRRAELTDAADVALRRIARDVRRAVPNTLRLKNASNNTVVDCAENVECYIEFIMAKTGGRYRDPADGSTGGNFLDFTGTLPNPCLPTPSRCFDFLGALPDPAIVADDFIVVYNLGEGYNPANAYNYNATTDLCGADGCNIARVAAAPSGSTVTLTANPFAAQSPPLPSPNARFQVVDTDDRVIRYGCVNNTLTRYSGCGFSDTTSGCTLPPSLLAGSATAEPRATCVIEYQANATGRNGLLYISLTLESGGESVTLFQQIHVDNAP